MTVSQRLLRVVPVVVAAVLVCWTATQNNADECGTVGECLGLAFDDLVALVLVVPGTAIALRLLRVPRVILHTLALLGICGALWFGAGELLRALDAERPYDATLPLWVAALVGLAAGVAATYVVGPGLRTPRAVVLRTAVPVVVVALATGASYASDRVAREHRIDEIATAPVTLYAPAIAGQGPQSAYASADGVRLSYAVEVAGEHAYVSVELVPTPTDSLCEELLVVAGDCVEDGDTLRHSFGSGFADVALVRGGTTLVAELDSDRLDPDEVLQALRDAPRVSAEDLA